MNIDKKTLLGVSIFSSAAPLLCCWGPVLLAGLAGGTGVATFFSWLHPLESYLFGFALISLGLSFYKFYKPIRDTSACSNCVNAESNGHGKWYLWIGAVLVLIMFVFNYYPGLFI
ncbi:MAG: hypothetical protein KDC93_08850 [Cyclobacteriaceae bacterium]|nr:hypothetical protein [Cyclobacteriaceae bacterium]